VTRIRRALAASVLTLALPATAGAQTPAETGPIPPARDARIYAIADAVSEERIEAYITRLAGFGTRNTFSDTLSDTRGIGAARRWIKAEFDAISAACGGCLEVFYQRDLVTAEDSPRIPQDTWVVNVVAVLRGTEYPDRYVIMSGDIDSRASNGSDGVTDAPGANDNASGMAGTIEAARVLSQYRFPKSVVFVGLSGEEQGLWGGQHMAEVAVNEGWQIEAVLNNDMIGNTQGIDGVEDNSTFRVFSEPVPATDELGDHNRRRTRGGEVDGPSRQVARYVARLTDEYLTNLNAMMIYRLDRFGRGGHHRPFNDVGFPAVRIMEAHEDYNRQHQDIRVEDGVEYGDVLEEVEFDYAARLTAVNAITLASMAWAPPPPEAGRLGGANSASAQVRWTVPENAPNLAGFKVYWRLTTEPQWTDWVYVGNVDRFTVQNINVDNYLFGVAAVAPNGNESPVVFVN